MASRRASKLSIKVQKLRGGGGSGTPAGKAKRVKASQNGRAQVLANQGERQVITKWTRN